MQMPSSGFDKWYAYSTERSSEIIDDYDSIYHDLLPFWYLSPAELRSRTWEMTSNPWNNIPGIVIRNGSAQAGLHIPGSHRWMIDGVIESLKPFVQWLPDMDIAFNLNDECRVMMRHEELSSMLGKNSSTGDSSGKISSDWSQQRAVGWKEVPEEPISETVFEDLSTANIFVPYGSDSCPASSRARRERVSNRSCACLSCAEPHSFQGFVQNWSLAADICHQPDLANLHGFFLSPAAFKGTHKLMPVFSQSKVHGYNDIL